MSAGRPNRMVLAAFVCLSLASPAFAGWSADPVEVFATPNICAPVAACGDGAGGAFVAWQELGGPLLVAHLTANGDLDSGWPAWLVVNSLPTPRDDLQAVSDELGGAWLTWRTGAGLQGVHVATDGNLQAGSPEASIVFAHPTTNSDVVADGEGGLYVAWVATEGVVLDGENQLAAPLRLLRIAPDGSTSPGWPIAGRVLSEPVDSLEWVEAFSIARPRGAGIWAAWAGNHVRFDMASTTAHLTPGDVRVARFDLLGLPFPGWSASGMSLGPFPWGDLDETVSLLLFDPLPWWCLPSLNLVAVAPDQTDGAFVLYGTDSSDPYDSEKGFRPTACRVGSTGEVLPGWPLNVSPSGWYTNPIRDDLGSSNSFRVLADADNGCFVAYPQRYTDAPDRIYVAQVTPGGVGLFANSVNPPGFEISSDGIGGAWWTSFYAGPEYLRTPYIHVLCENSGSSVFYETHSSPIPDWYGDTGLATGFADGGSIFFWSQHRERHGVYAVRLNRAGVVTDVPRQPLLPAPPHFTVRFAPGAGIRASLALAGAGEARLLLADVTGRAVARETFAIEAGAREWTIGGTEALAPGLYFARVERGGETISSRVVVTR